MLKAYQALGQDISVISINSIFSWETYSACNLLDCGSNFFVKQFFKEN